jgi:hypothetical protein
MFSTQLFLVPPKMLFSTITIGLVTAVSAALASPASTPGPLVVAGSMVTDKAVTYEMSILNEIKAFDYKVDNGEYPRPVTYQVNAGYNCIFYT